MEADRWAFPDVDVLIVYHALFRNTFVGPSLFKTSVKIFELGVVYMAVRCHQLKMEMFLVSECNAIGKTLMKSGMLNCDDVQKAFTGGKVGKKSIEG